MAGGNSYNGWPASDSASAIGIDTGWKVCGADYPGGVKAGDVATVFSYLVDRLHHEVEAMMTDPDNGSVGYGCWGWSYRANVNNPSQLSCHASGTALDFNAPKHANGTSTGPNGGGGWTGEQYHQIQAILADCSGVVRWLTSNDPMHFEISGSAGDVAAAAAKLGGITSEYEDDALEDGMALSEEALAQIRQVVQGAVRDEIGPGAIENPDASLNAGIGKRAKIDRHYEFEAVPGYRPGD